MDRSRYINFILFCILRILIAYSVLFLVGCAPTIYGVPKEEWQKMSEEQRQIAIQGYNERERLREQRRLKEAEREAREAEIRAIEARRQEQLRKERIDAIYRGEGGQYGDLIRVGIQGGEMKIGGKHRNYHPVSFKIANGEIRKLEIVSIEHKGYIPKDELLVKYEDGTLFIDYDDFFQDSALRLIYEQGWKSGKTYTVNTESRLKFRNVQIYVEIIPHLRRVKEFRQVQ